MQIPTVSIFKTYVPERNKTYSNKYVQNPFELKKDVFERTCAVSFNGKEEKEYANIQKKTVVTELKQTGEYAQESLNKQIARDGWAGKTANWVKGAWKSKNRAHIVKSDIEVYKKQVKELEKSLQEGNFDKKFKEIFDVDYNQSNIDDYNKKAENFMLATTITGVTKIIDKKLSTPLKEFNKNNGCLKDKVYSILNSNSSIGTIIQYDEIIKKEDILENFKKELVDVVGSEKILEKTAKTQGVNLATATDDEKYKVYGKIANYLIETIKLTSEKCTEGKNLKELKKEYEEAYENAYGTKNDIQERVEKYNRSQRIGSEAVKGVAIAGLVAASVLTLGSSAPILVGAGATFTASLASESLDYATNSIEGDLSANFKNIFKGAVLDSATYALTYGLSNMMPISKAATKIGKVTLNVTKDTAIDTVLTAGKAYLERGEVSKKELGLVALAAAAFSSISYSSKVFDFSNSIKNGNKAGLSKEVINQSIKNKLLKEATVETANNIALKSIGSVATQVGIENNPVQQYLNEAKEKIQKDYAEQPEIYEELYTLSIDSPEQFDNIVLKILANKIIEESENPTK